MTTVPSIEYVVTTSSTCTVTDDATGKVLVTAYAGQQAVFQAISESVTLSDPDATVKARRCPFESAPGEALSLTGGSELPRGYTRLEFLESTGEQYIDIGEADSSVAGMRVECELVGGPPGGWSILGGSMYSGTDLFSLLMRNAKGIGYQYGTKTEYPTTDGGGVSSGSAVGDKGYMPSGRITVKMNWLNEHIWEVPECNLVRTLGSLYKNTSRFALFARYSRTQGVYTNPESARIFCAELSHGSKITMSLEPVVAPDGAPCMFDRVSKKTLKNVGSGQFVAGVATVAQLTALLNRLPSTGGALSLSLPAEANTPEVADMLQACHDSKGWTLTVHEYRPAAASTYSLRRVREVVWCRRATVANGPFVDGTGTRWQIDRCSAIFGRLGNDPASYCYTPFDSVEQAAEFWEMQPYVDPNAELETEPETEPEL